MKFCAAVLSAARGLVRSGKSQRAAARLLNLSESGLRCALQRSRRPGRRSRLGRPPAITKSQRRDLLKIANKAFRRGGTTTAGEIIRKLKLDVDERTVCKALAAVGKGYLKRANAPQHTTSHCKSTAENKGILRALHLKILLLYLT
jgi:transposase